MKKEFINSLQSWRGICAVMIFLHHYPGFEKIAYSFGDSVVCFFMMLSGFVMSDSMMPKAEKGTLPSEISFLKSRFFKIYPLYFISLIATWIMLGKDIHPKIALLDLTLLQAWWPNLDFNFSGNAPTWFISSLIFSYIFVLPILRATARHRKNFIYILGGALAYYAVAMIVTPSDKVLPFIYINPTMQFIVFLIGMGCREIYMDIEKGNKVFFAHAKTLLCGKRSSGIILMTLILIWVAMLAIHPHLPMRLQLSACWWVITAMLIIIFAVTDKCHNLIQRIFHNRLFVALGNISFSFYIIHYPVIKLMERLYPSYEVSHSGATIVLVMTLAVTTLLAYLSGKYIEQPIFGLYKSRSAK